ncbi:T9SS type A sorting domain-containing protein [Kordia sp.]|uniref:T9SS type A sorting domain-containing protein n=1 Tax=Kordia sp. TaxID=1965332 RepID=UPI003D6B9288
MPVIIPPIKKDSVAASLESYHANNYPHIITTNYTPSETNYMVQIDLVKYDNEHDYINDFDNYTTGPSLTIHLTTSTNSSFSPEDSTDSFSVTTHPNPSTNHIVFEYPNTSDRNSISKQLPLDVIIFNNKGVKMNQYSLTSTSSKTNNISYNLNISHLQKGRYYFQLSREGKTQVKIIQKE